MLTKHTLTEREDSCIAGTKAGGRKAAATNKEKYGDDYYVKMGAKGGSVSGIAKGWALQSPEKRREAGRRGGKLSRRGRAKK